MSASFEAQLHNLSLSGAGLVGPAGAAEKGEAITLMLEHGEGLMSFAVSATVIRIAPAEGDQVVYGVHFDALPPDTRGELVMMLRMIAAGRGSQRRSAPRVASRLSVTCTSSKSFRAVLNDLSRGGFSVRSKRAMTIGEQLQAKFGVEGLPGLLDLQGPIVNVVPLKDGTFRVGVQFDPLPDATAQRVMSLIELLLGLEPRNAVIIEDEVEESAAVGPIDYELTAGQAPLLPAHATDGSSYELPDDIDAAVVPVTAAPGHQYELPGEPEFEAPQEQAAVTPAPFEDEEPIDGEPLDDDEV